MIWRNDGPLKERKDLRGIEGNVDYEATVALYRAAAGKKKKRKK